MTTIAVLPSGEIRAIYDDAVDLRALLGEIPRRASRIEVIEKGKRRGDFGVSFEPLADQLGDDGWRFCLAETFRSYEEAKRAEVAWLRRNYLNVAIP